MVIISDDGKTIPIEYRLTGKINEGDRIKKEYKAAGRRSEIQEVIKELHRNFRQTAPDLPLDL